LEIAPIHGLGRIIPVLVWVMAAGLALEASGLFFAIWARHHLGRHWSGEITIKVGHDLIRSGPYRYLRHPIYTGVLAMYSGILLVTCEWLALPASLLWRWRTGARSVSRRRISIAYLEPITRHTAERRGR